MSRIIAVCNQKGGVGKTTTALNLAAYLASFGKTTLLIDIDPQGNSTSGIGVDKHAITNSIYNVLIDRKPIGDAIVQTAVQNLWLAPSNVDLTGFEIEAINNPAKEYMLKSAIEGIRDAYEFIIIDSPPSLGLLTINALTAIESVLIPIQCEYYALEGLSQLLNVITLVRQRLNNELRIEGVLLTMADYRTRLTTEVINEVKRYFDSDEGSLMVGGRNKVYRTVISRSVRLSEAPGFGKPIFIYDKNSIGAKQYFELAKEVLGEAAAGPADISNNNRIKDLQALAQQGVIDTDIRIETETKKIEDENILPL